jgi:methionine-gamma-lyase
MISESAGFATKAIHGGNTHDSQYGALTAPIYQTATFCFENCEQGRKRFDGAESGFIYTRVGNPTTNALEKKLAMLENAEAALALSSGMGAIASVFWTLCAAGKHIVADKTLYGCSFEFLSQGITKYGVEVSLIELNNPAELAAALRPNTAAVYFETPANPTLKLIDIEAVAKTAHEYNPKIKVIADNTFATPYLTRPLDLGCDIVVHSATKYLNGHGDVIAGFICGKESFIAEARLIGLKYMTGSVPGPFEAFLILRGLKTLELRMERHCANAERLAAYLAAHPKVQKVYYPGSANHPGHETAKKQMLKFGGMISFEVKGGRTAGEKLLNSLKLCALAVSLGDAETLVEHPASMTHHNYTPEALAEACIPEGLVRVSVGLENIEDIIADFEMGFERI